MADGDDITEPPASLADIGRWIDSPEGLSALPQLSVVQFRGPASEPLVWQLDQEWFSAGLHFPMISAEFPPDAFPAYVLWTPEAD